MRSFLPLSALTTIALVAACSGTVTQATGSTTSGSSAGAGAGATSAGSTSSSSGGATGGSSANTSSASGTSTSTSTSSVSSSGSSGATQHGECKTSADCGGLPCEPVTPGGYLVCIKPVMQATSCMVQGAQNQCCTSADCKGGGSCYQQHSVEGCGGAFLANNVCLADGCTTDAECTSKGTPGICAPAGAFGYPQRECLPAYCKTDADCTAKAGGACVPVGGDTCCSLLIPDGFVCSYPGDCASGGSCPSGDECSLDTATAAPSCQMQQPCPP